MAGWHEADQASYSGATLADGDLTAPALPVPEGPDRLVRWEPEEHLARRLCDPGGPDEVRLRSHPRSAGAARRVVRSVLRSWGLHQQAESAELLTGELVANAIRHTGGQTVGLRVGRRPGRIRVEVRDSSRALPCLIISAEPGGTNGRGLVLVDTLADRWGADLLPRGKSVWFELRTGERGDTTRG